MKEFLGNLKVKIVNQDEKENQSPYFQIQRAVFSSGWVRAQRAPLQDITH